MRVCYHVQSHTAPRQVARLVHRIRSDSPSSLILVSHQAGGVGFGDELHGLSGVHVLPTTGGYGDFSHVERYLESVRWLRNHGEEVDWVVNLSGQDYPLVDLADAESQLAASTADAFMETFPVFSELSHWSRRNASIRYEFRHRRIGRVTARRQRWTRPLAAVNAVQPWLRFSPTFLSLGVRAGPPVAPALTLYGGSFFCNLSRRAVDTVVDFHDRYPEVVRWFRGMLAPEEVFFQTVLGNARDIGIVNDCKRYFDFTQSHANHPKTLTLADLPAMRRSGAWFARKIDPGCDDLVGRLDELAAADGEQLIRRHETLASYRAPS
jgi:Core-2/I-Branching enzyme